MDTYRVEDTPFGYTLSVIGGKWKMVIMFVLVEHDVMRYSELKRAIPGITHKMLSAQLKELEADGIVTRTEYQQVPPKVEYVLTPSGEQLIPALDILYIWSIRQMHDRRIPIDADAFVVHKSEKYVDALGDIMRENNFWPGRERRRGVEQGEE